MQFTRSPIAMAVAPAGFSALPFAADAATPAPGSGTLAVWFKAPLNGSTVKGVLNGDTSCYVNATGAVSRVVFTVDGKALMTDTAPSDGMNCVLDTTKLANGTHSLRADAYTSSGAVKTDIISINVQNAVNTAPTVGITSPAAGQTVSGTLNYAASATDNGGVSRVVFTLDGNALLSDTTAPYGGSLDTTKLANGTHTLRAVAYDAQGLNTASQVSFNVSNTVTSTGQTPAPGAGSLAVWFKSPLAGSTIKGVLNGGTSCYVNATGSVQRVVFTLDGAAVNTDSAPADGMNCTLDTTRFANGTHTLRAVAFDSSGASKIDDVSVNIQNTVANTAPTVSITSPSAGQTVSGTSLAYAAIASDNAGVTKVDFSVDSSALASDTSSPYGGTLDTTKLANGTHVLKAVAYDAQGLNATSQVSINVQNTVTPTPTPTSTTTPPPGSGSLAVWFKSPLAGATVSGSLSGSTCYVNATGSVQRVVFTLDGGAVNTDSAPADGMNCTLDTAKFANGTHSLRADAYDSTGAVKTDIISVNFQNSGSTVTPTLKSNKLRG